MPKILLRPVSVVTNVAPLMNVIDKLNAENVPQEMDDEFADLETLVVLESNEGGINHDGVWEVEITVKPSSALLEFAGKVWARNG